MSFAFTDLRAVRSFLTGPRAVRSFFTVPRAVFTLVLGNGQNFLVRVNAPRKIGTNKVMTIKTG